MVFVGHDHRGWNDVVKNSDGEDVLIVGGINAAKTVGVANIMLIYDEASKSWNKEISGEIIEVKDYAASDEFMAKFNYVVDELKAIQFKIRKKGGRWKETRITYKIKNKKDGIKVKLVSTIGVVLEQRLARQDRTGRYGDTGEPGPFRGGRKVKERDKDKKK